MITKTYVKQTSSPYRSCYYSNKHFPKSHSLIKRNGRGTLIPVYSYSDRSTKWLVNSAREHSKHDYELCSLNGKVHISAIILLYV